VSSANICKFLEVPGFELGLHALSLSHLDKSLGLLTSCS